MTRSGGSAMDLSCAVIRPIRANTSASQKQLVGVVHVICN